MPEELREASHVTGIELDPVTARIARLLQPQARIVTGDFTRTELPASFDLTVGNPPFTDRAKRRQHGRSASSWTNADERLFQQHVAELALARRGEVDALTRKLDRQEKAIAELRTRNRDSIARVKGDRQHTRRMRANVDGVEWSEGLS
jgi:tRNA1(Val) A37 N6-methylase TrmN6